MSAQNRCHLGSPPRAHPGARTIPAGGCDNQLSINAAYRSRLALHQPEGTVSVQTAATTHNRSRDDRRLGERTPLDRPGTLRVASAAPVDVILRDLTRDGCCIETDVELSPDMLVAIGVPGVGISEARVVWRGARGYGCAFARSLPPGSITAAFSPTNVRAFPNGNDAEPTPASSPKPSARSRLLLITALMAGSWGIIGTTIGLWLS